jgi:hypothetical protein
MMDTLQHTNTACSTDTQTAQQWGEECSVPQLTEQGAFLHENMPPLFMPTASFNLV